MCEIKITNYTLLNRSIYRISGCRYLIPVEVKLHLNTLFSHRSSVAGIMTRQTMTAIAPEVTDTGPCSPPLMPGHAKMKEALVDYRLVNRLYEMQCSFRHINLPSISTILHQHYILPHPHHSTIHQRCLHGPVYNLEIFLLKIHDRFLM